MFKFSDLHLCIIIIIISKITWYVHVLVHHTNRSPIFQRITKHLRSTIVVIHRYVVFPVWHTHFWVVTLRRFRFPRQNNEAKFRDPLIKLFAIFGLGTWRSHLTGTISQSQLLKHERVLLSTWQEGSGYSRMISKICKEFDYGFLPLF